MKRDLGDKAFWFVFWTIVSFVAATCAMPATFALDMNGRIIECTKDCPRDVEASGGVAQTYCGGSSDENRNPETPPGKYRRPLWSLRSDWPSVWNSDYRAASANSPISRLLLPCVQFICMHNRERDWSCVNLRVRALRPWKASKKPNALRIQNQAIWNLDCDAGEMQKSEHDVISELRRSRNFRMCRVAGIQEIPGLVAVEWIRRLKANRQAEQRRQLRTGKLSLGFKTDQREQQAKQSFAYSVWRNKDSSRVVTGRSLYRQSLNTQVQDCK